MVDGNAEVRRIEDQLRRSMEGPAWHGPALEALLAGVTTRQALWRALPGAHTIWELVVHITAWQDAARRRLAGEPADLGPDEDWPPLGEISGERWADAVAGLRRSNTRLREAVLALADDDLQRQTASPEPHSFYSLLHGVVQHNLYHAGQIALLKKAAV